MTPAITQSDALALAMLAVLTLSFGCVLVILVSMHRRGRAADREVEKLLEDVAAEADESAEPEKAGPPEDDSPGEPWEREADWWKR